MHLCSIVTSDSLAARKSLWTRSPQPNCVVADGSRERHPALQRWVISFIQVLDYDFVKINFVVCGKCCIFAPCFAKNNILPMTIKNFPHCLKMTYASPEVEVLELLSEGVLCLSGEVDDSDDVELF